MWHGRPEGAARLKDATENGALPGMQSKSKRGDMFSELVARQLRALEYTPNALLSKTLLIKSFYNHAINKLHAGMSTWLIQVEARPSASVPVAALDSSDADNGRRVASSVYSVCIAFASDPGSSNSGSSKNGS